MTRKSLPALAFIALTLAAPAQAAPSGTAPGAPGAKAVWGQAGKDGYGTAADRRSKVWFTLDNGSLSEVYYSDLSTPSVRSMELVVSDGKTFTERESEATTKRVSLLDRDGLTYRQVNTARSGRYRITKTYVTDPARDTLLVRTRFESLTGKRYRVYVLYDPALSNNGNDDGGVSGRSELLSSDATAASALAAAPRFTKTSSGFVGSASDGWEDLKTDNRMDFEYGSAHDGNVVQLARTSLNGRRGHQRMTLALGFAPVMAAAQGAAHASLRTGFARVQRAYGAGWRAYLAKLKRRPKSVSKFPRTYRASVMTLAAHEDKTYRGAYIASPTMPWAWGLLTIDKELPSGPYHLVWPRDLYQIATGLLAAGDRAGAQRSLNYMFQRQQKPDGSFPQNTYVNGIQRWKSLQLDEVALPIVLAWQLRRNGAGDYEHIKRAADFIVTHGPVTEQERWENQGGYSPGTIASEIAGLICAADIARKNGDAESASRWEAFADDWQRNVEGWTATTNGPYSPKPYYLRVTKDGNPNAGTAYSIGDGGPGHADQRTITDPSYLELVRLGVKRFDDPVVVATKQVVDQRLSVRTPNGRLWHRFDFDGYGEKADGGPWDITDPDTFTTFGRLWPIFAGERGEYELLAGRKAGTELRTMARSANAGELIPEQVWDYRPPGGRPGFKPGEQTESAAPLAWSHAQFVRLAWSIQSGRPVERPRVVACRYSGC
jgi:glucoamylase